MKLQVLGRGCEKCHTLEENAREAAAQTSGEVEVETVYDITEATAMGMMDAPGLAVDGTLVIQGRIPDPEEIGELIDSK